MTEAERIELREAIEKLPGNPRLAIMTQNENDNHHWSRSVAMITKEKLALLVDADGTLADLLGYIFSRADLDPREIMAGSAFWGAMNNRKPDTETPSDEEVPF
ncbi:MAG: hypothetical protein AAGJ50_03595 [Pseudomonadota bacterium]